MTEYTKDKAAYKVARYISNQNGNTTVWVGGVKFNG